MTGLQKDRVCRYEVSGQVAIPPRLDGAGSGQTAHTHPHLPCETPWLCLRARNGAGRACDGRLQPAPATDGRTQRPRRAQPRPAIDGRTRDTRIRCTRTNRRPKRFTSTPVVKTFSEFSSDQICTVSPVFLTVLKSAIETFRSGNTDGRHGDQNGSDCYHLGGTHNLW